MQPLQLKKTQQEEKGLECDLSKVHCYSCNQYGHFATNLPNNKKQKKDVATSAEVEEYTTYFDREFSLSSFDSSVGSSIFQNAQIVVSGQLDT